MAPSSVNEVQPSAPHRLPVQRFRELSSAPLPYHMQTRLEHSSPVGSRDSSQCSHRYPFLHPLSPQVSLLSSTAEDQPQAPPCPALCYLSCRSLYSLSLRSACRSPVSPPEPSTGCTSRHIYLLIPPPAPHLFQILLRPCRRCRRQRPGIVLSPPTPLSPYTRSMPWSKFRSPGISSRRTR